MNKLYLVDTHCHLWHPEYKFDLKEVLRQAQSEGFRYFINVGVNLETSQQAIRIAKRYNSVYAAVGFHPQHAKEFNLEQKLKLKKLLKKKKVVALGEIGLDFYRRISNITTQIALLEEILKIWQEEKNLPLIIHNRRANKKILEILRRVENLKPKIVMHCFSGDREFLNKCLERGYFISYATNVTYSKELQELVRHTPLDRLLLETDSPYLAPQEVRGQRNKPSYLRHSIKLVAEIKQIQQEDLIRALALNAKLVFGVGRFKYPPQIVYKYRGELYLNLTNKCSNKCDFCFSHHSDYFGGYNLRLRKEPSVKEIIKAVEREKIDRKEITFCGYGEPFMRLQELKEIAEALKRKGYSIRIVTNGQGNLIAGRNVLPELEGLVDKISISLNFVDEDKYEQICKPEFGEETYGKVIEFVREAKKYIPWVEITFLDIPGINLDRCKEVARSLGVSFRIREFNILK